MGCTKQIARDSYNPPSSIAITEPKALLEESEISSFFHNPIQNGKLQNDDEITRYDAERFYGKPLQISKRSAASKNTARKNIEIYEYLYAGMDFIWAISEDGRDLCFSRRYFDKNISFTNGILLGMKKKDIPKSFGYPISEDNDSMTFSVDGDSLGYAKFLFSNGVLKAIELYSNFE